MRTALIYYLVKTVGFTAPHAIAVYALSSTACVAMGVAGSFSADRWIGAHRAIVAGAGLMALASFALMFQALLYPGLALMAAGNGLFKSPMVAQVGALYRLDDPRRDRAFVVYKVGCNLGSFLAPLICGTLGAVYGWNRAFLAAGIGMVMAMGIFILGRSELAPAGKPLRAVTDSEDGNPSENVHGRSWLLFLAWIGAVLFWVAYRQTESTVALWIDQGVNRTLAIAHWRFVFPAAWFQSLNPLLIFVLAPMVSKIWRRQDRRASLQRELGKMMTGCGLLALAFVGIAATALERTSGVAVGLCLLGAVSLLTLGELYLDPIGQALFSRRASPGLHSLYVSFWFLASGSAYFISAWLGQIWARVSPWEFFLGMAAVALLGGMILALAKSQVHSPDASVAEGAAA
jgi:POT family proton-dependent oligopeptide transporter